MTLVSSTKPALVFLSWVLMCSLPLAGCTAAPKFEAAKQANLWLCEDGSSIETRQVATSLWLQLPASTEWLELEQKRAASGIRFSNSAGAWVWQDGQKAKVGTPQRSWHNCQLMASGKPGNLDKPQLSAGTNFAPEAVVLEAQGDYPPWQLTTKQKGTGLFLQNYGTKRIHLKDIKITAQNPVATHYQAQDEQGNKLVYRVENVLCVSEKTGQPFMHRVYIEHLNTKFKGCGQSF